MNKLPTQERALIGGLKGIFQGELPSRGVLVRLGIASSIAILLGSLAPDSPFTSKIPGSWALGIPSGFASLNFLSGAPGQILFYLGFAMGILVWFELVRSVRENLYTTRDLVRFALYWFSPLLLAGPLYSKDVYSYAAIGEMVSRHISPYLYGPNILGATPYLNPVDPIWGNAPAPYGPIFLWFSGVLASISGHDPFVTMLMLRVFTIATVVILAIIAMRLASAKGRDPNLALVLVGLNPLIVFHLASSAHNDAYMVVLLGAGLLAFYRKRPILAVVLMSLGAAIKIPAILGVAFVAWSAVPGNDIRKKIKPAAFYGAISIATLGMASLVTGLGWGWIHNLGTPGLVRSPAVPTTAMAAWSDRLTSLLGLSLGFSGWLTVYRALGFLLAGLVGLYFLFNTERFGIEKALGYSLLALVLFGPVIQPWYIAWGLVLVATNPTPRAMNGVVAVSVFGMLLGLPDGPSVVSWTVYVMMVLGLVVYAGDRLGWKVAQETLQRATVSVERFSHSS